MIKTEDYLREFIIIFFSQQRVIIWTTVAIFALSAAVAMFWPPTYVVEGSVLVKGKRSMRSPESLESVQLRTVLVDKEDLNSEAEILTSMEVIGLALEGLRKEGKVYADKNLSGEQLQALAATIRDGIKTVILPNSNIIEIKLFGKDAQLAQAVLHEVMANYVLRRRDVYNPKGMEDFFAGQVGQFDKGLQQEERRLLDLAAKSGSADAEQEIANNLTLKMELERQLYADRSKLTENQKFADHISNVLASEGIQFFSFIDNLSITHLGDQLQQLVVERGQAIRIYHPESKQIARIDEQVANLNKTLKNEVRTYKEGIESRIRVLQETTATLERDIQALEDKNLRLYEGHVAWQRVQREMALRSQSFGTFSQRLEEARIGSGTEATNLFSISILSWPKTPLSPIFPKPNRVIPMGLLAGFITGCCLGFLREYFDHTFKRPEDAERYAALPAIFSIPLDQ
ncbi:MAG: hypothetical protein KKE73_11485 [Proteobacteria bacterium]|nr:hypothetical protein [Pseudomonadota bacterium]